MLKRNLSTQHKKMNTKERWGRQDAHRHNREKLIHALQVSAHSGPGRPSGSAGRPLVYAWAASCRQSLPPSGRCSLLAACRPPPPAGKVALLILYLKHRKHRESREQSLNARHSVMHQSWNNVNSICIISAKSNLQFLSAEVKARALSDRYEGDSNTQTIMCHVIKSVVSAVCYTFM